MSVRSVPCSSKVHVPLTGDFHFVLQLAVVVVGFQTGSKKGVRTRAQAKQQIGDGQHSPCDHAPNGRDLPSDDRRVNAFTFPQVKPEKTHPERLDRFGLSHMALPKGEYDEVAEFLETCSSTLLSGLPSPLVMGATVIKEEPGEEDEEEKGEDSVVVKDNRNGSSSSSLTMGFVGLPKPMEGLNEAGPPAFLRKTYEMVDDPEMDDLVSWSDGGCSFVVWDQYVFSKHLLPRYFKHRNFSSFIRQLNTYGFKKIDLDRWEFANEGFQRGKRHLLRSINRRGRNNKRRRGSPLVEDKRAALFESNDLEILRNDQDALRGEVVKLRQQEEDLHSAITEMAERIRCTELRQQNMFLFLAKAVKNPTYVEKLMEKRKRRAAERNAGDAVTRKRKPQEISGPEAHLVPIRNSDHAFREVLITGDMSPGSPRVALPEALGVQGRNGLRDILPEMSPEQYSQGRIGQSSYDNEAMSGDPISQSTAANGGGEEMIGVDDSTIYLELDNLVEKPFGWELGLGSDLKEQTMGVGLLE